MNMTPDERKRAFAEAYNALVQTYGVIVVAVPHIEVYGDLMQIKPPTVDMEFVDNWQPAQPNSSSNGSADRKPKSPRLSKNGKTEKVQP